MRMRPDGEDLRHPKLWLAGGLALAAAAALLAAVLPDAAAWPSALGHLLASLQRLVLALALAGGAGVPLAVAMRRWQRVETALTPWLLTATAMPWVLIAVALNMMAHLRLGPDGATWLAAAGGVAWLLSALGPRRQADGARTAQVRRAVRTVVLMLLAAELLALDQGVGTQLRVHVLSWSPPQLLLYAGGLLALLGAAALAARLGAPRLIRATARLAEPPG